MAVKRNYIPWTPAEEKRLLSWVAKHHRWSWKKMAAMYKREHAERTADSLRSKYCRLSRGHRRTRHVPLYKDPASSPSTMTTPRVRDNSPTPSLETMEIPSPPKLVVPICKPKAVFVNYPPPYRRPFASRQSRPSMPPESNVMAGPAPDAPRPQVPERASQHKLNFGRRFRLWDPKPTQPDNFRAW